MTVARRLPALLLLLAGAALTSSCLEEREAGAAAVARTALLGLSDIDIRMCAGFPSRTADIEQGQIWTYERNINRGGVSIALPTVDVGVFPALGGGSLSVAPGGYCNTQIRFSKGRVVDIAYAGDNDLPRRRNALCTSIIDECVDYVRRQHPATPRN
jgi:hypothetical protein